MKPIRFSVIIPTHSAKSLPAAIRALDYVDYPMDLIEIIVSEGKNPSAQRNAGAKQASGEFLYFLDDDSIADIDLFRFAARSLMDGRIEIVGGPSEIIPGERLLQRCIGYVLGSFFATANIRCRYRAIGRTEQPGTEQNLILCNLAVRRKSFEAAGGFDERLYPNEENEFLNRMMRKGYLAKYNPKMVVARPHRGSLRDFVRQMHSYGNGRMQHFRITPSFTNPIYLLPVAFMAYVLSIPLILHFLDARAQAAIYLLPFVTYLLGMAVSTLRIVAEEKDLLSTLVVPLLFPVVHASYALGLLRGVTSKLRHQGSSTEEDAGELGTIPKVWLVKPFGTTFIPEDSPQSEAIGNEAFLVRELA